MAVKVPCQHCGQDITYLPRIDKWAHAVDGKPTALSCDLTASPLAAPADPERPIRAHLSPSSCAELAAIQHEENQAKLEALAIRYANLPVRQQTILLEGLENSILAAEYAVRTRRDQDETDCPECQRTGTVTQVPGTLPVCRSCDWTGWVNVPEPPS